MSDNIVRSAVISTDGRYRYVLHRDNISPDATGRVVWIMLNPSTADGEVDDPTIRRCIGYTRDWGYRDLSVVNLFPVRLTDSKLLKGNVEPPEITKINTGFLESETIFNDPVIVVCAWGALGVIAQREKKVVRHLTELGVQLNVLRLSEDRHPWHPLYLPKALKPIPWSGQ